MQTESFTDIVHSKDKLQVIALKDPFDRNCKEIRTVPWEGKTIQTYANEIFSEVPEEFEVVSSIDGGRVDPLLTIPNPGSCVVFALAPRDSNFGRMMAMLAVIAISIYVPGAQGLALTGWQAAAVQAGIMVAGTFLVNTLLPVTPEETDPAGVSSAYSWNGVNQIEEGYTAPVIYGTVKTVPYLIGKYIEEIYVTPGPSKQKLNLLYFVADHAVDAIGYVKINGNDYDGYPDVYIDTSKKGSLTQGVIAKFRDTHEQHGDGRKISGPGYGITDWAEINIPGDSITAIGVGFSAPAGLGYWNNDGNVEYVNIGYTVEYALQGTENWQPWIDTFVGYATASAVRFGRQTNTDHINHGRVYPGWNGDINNLNPRPYTGKDLTPGAYKIRIKCNGAPTLDRRYVTEFYLDYIDGISKDDFRYPGNSLLAVQAIASDQLSGGLPTVSCIVSRNYVSVWNGSSWVNKPANNPAWACWDMIVNDDYGGGANEARMIYSDFSTWASFCTTNGYTCNIVMDTTTDMPTALAKVSILGRGRVVQKGTKIGAIIDQAADPEQLFGVGNIKEGTFKKSYLAKKDRANSISVTYFDADQDYERLTFELRAANFDTDQPDANKLDLVLEGATSKTLAVKHAKFLLNCNQYLIRFVEFEVGVDALASNVGDVIYVSHDVPQWGYSGHVVSATSDTVTIDRSDDENEEGSITLTPGTTYHILVRHYDDDDLEEVAINTSLTISTYGLTTNTFILSGSWGQIPAKDDIYSFGEITKVAKEFRITSITRGQEMNRKIQAMEYRSEVYSDSASIPDYESETALLPYVEGLIARETYKKEGGLIVSYISLTWRGFGLCFLYMKEEAASQWTLVSSYTSDYWADIRNVEPGKTYYFAVSTTANPADGDTTTVTFKGYTPPRIIWPVTGLQIYGQGNTTIWQNRDLKLTWNLSTSSFPDEADGEGEGAGTFPPMTDFGGYRIQILNNDGSLRREIIQLENVYNYTYEMNSEDGHLNTMIVGSRSGNFVEGEMIYQYPSGASAKVVSVSGNTLGLSNMSSTAFVVGQIVYQASYGSELITDGDCSSDSFSKGTAWTYDGVNEEYDCDGTNNPEDLYQNVLEASCFYITQGTIKNYVSGVVSFGGSLATYYSSNGIKTSVYQQAAGDSNYYITGQSFIGSVTDISVKKITIAAIAATVPTAGAVGSYSDAEPNLIIKVWARDRYGQESDVPAILVVSNPAPSAPSGLTLTAILKGIQAGWLPSTEVDVKNGGHYKYRCKVESDSWSEWIETGSTFFSKVLTTSEQDSYGVAARIYVEVKAVDSFGNESSASSGNKEAQGLYIQPEDVIGELVSNLELSDSDSNTAATLAKLYDGTTDSDGVAYTVSGTDKYIEYSFPLQEIVDRLNVWTAGSGAHVYIAYSEDGDTWNYLSGEADHTLTEDLKLVDRGAVQADAQTNYWTLGSGNNYASFPAGIIAHKCRLYLMTSETIYELIFVRSVQAEQVIATELTAIVAALGSVVTGTLESESLGTDVGMFVDLNNELIQFGGTRVDADGTYAGIFLGKDGSYYNAFLGDPAAGYIQVNSETGVVTVKGGIIVTGGSGVANFTDAGDLATLDEVNGSYIAANSVIASHIYGAGFGTLTLTAGSIEIDTSAGIKIKTGADIYMESASGGNTGLINFVGNSRTYSMGTDYGNDRLVIYPDSNGVGSIWIGYDPSGTLTKVNNVAMYSSAQINMNVNNGSGGVAQLLINTGSAILTTVTDGYLRPNDDSTSLLGTGSYCWKNIYGDAGVTGCSDKKWKINVKQSPLGLEFINKLDFIEWEFDHTKGKTRKGKFHGVLAQDVLAVLEEMGYTNHDFAGVNVEPTEDGTGENWGFVYEQLIAPIGRAVQELFERLKALEGS